MGLKARSLLVVLLMLLMGGAQLHAGEVLYNGIELPDQWPPEPEAFPIEEPVTPPYLVSPPAVIPIDVGRQLFVDDFLIERTTLERVFHQPEWHPDTPVLEAKGEAEMNGGPFAAPFSDGVWYDPADNLFKMWYMAGTAAYFGYATSTDGIHWNRPETLEESLWPESNLLKIEPVSRDSSTVWMDLDASDPDRRFTLVYFRSGLQTRFSPDGIHWSDVVVTHSTGDRTTMFHNPFRDVWVYSIRAGARGAGRARWYAEATDMAEQAFEQLRSKSMWTCADNLDLEQFGSGGGELPDLYNLDATPYESLMLGLFTIHSREAEGDRPKVNTVSLGYSRDGFYWHRPDRRPFLDVSDDNEAWNYGNVQSAGGGCLVVGNKLYFYCSGRNSHQEKDDGAGGTTGLAVLRRDGFASMNAGEQAGELTTRPVTFDGQHLFVNVDAPEGELRVEVLDEQGQVIEPFNRANCQPIAADSTIQRVTWGGAEDLAAVADQPVRLRFHLTHGKLYAFWVSPDESGASHGYVAAGGPGFVNHQDTVGQQAYEAAQATDSR